MTELHADIQRLIVKALVSGRAATDFKNPSNPQILLARGTGLSTVPNPVTERQDQQECLARMMRSSKVSVLALQMDITDWVDLV